jgi:D-glycero-D-manno-heptose 1,7-bisphosphate phosphatase
MGIGAMKRAVFFDRDGVLNDAVVRDGKPYPPASVAELHVADGASRAVRAVHDANFLAVVVTNQPDVARGTTSRDAVEAINSALAERLGVDATYTCMHDDDDGCDCRKPRPGLAMQAAQELGIELSASYLIGDRTKDIGAGRAAGCTTVFIDRGYAETTGETGADFTVSTLDEAIARIAEREKRSLQ